MQTYFIQIAMIKLSAKLLNNEGAIRYPHYACIGTFPYNADMNLKNIKQSEGIDDLIDKADAFRLGQNCGKVINGYLKNYDHEQLLQKEAAVAKIFLGESIQSNAKTVEGLKMIFKAFIRRSQIQTHTTKPGYENVDLWLESFYRLQEKHEALLDHFTHLITDSKNQMDGKVFFSKDDPIVNLALNKQAVDNKAIQNALESKTISVFGDMLKEIYNLETR